MPNIEDVEKGLGRMAVIEDWRLFLM